MVGSGGDEGGRAGVQCKEKGGRRSENNNSHQ